MCMPTETNTMNNTITTNVKKIIGLGKFSRSNSPIPMSEESSCSTPRRISFNEEDQCEDFHDSLLSLLQMENSKPMKTVRFAPQYTTMESTEILTEEHCHELWHQKAELAAIKHAAKVLIANRKQIQENPDASSDELDCLTGLERFSRKRAVWKKSTIRCVLMAQRQVDELLRTSSYDFNNHGLSKEDYIQAISLRCTGWARDAAEKQGFRDYCTVHDPLASLFSDNEFNENEQNYNELIFGETPSENTNTSNKRKVEATEPMDSGRRIRYRVGTPPLLV